MNLQEKFIRENNLYENYVSWLESQVVETDSPSDSREDKETDIIRKYINNYRENESAKKFGYETLISYLETDLDYETQVIFPRLLSNTEKDTVNNIINYWSVIPYVSVEGNYDISWSRELNCNIVTISIDFTKSASDDYALREVLEKLAKWISEGTPERKDGSQKYHGIIKPIVVRADQV